MNQIEAIKGDNCFYYILLNLISKKSGVQIPEYFLYFVFGRIYFKYTSESQLGNQRLPKIDLLQYSEQEELTKWLGIEKKWHEPENEVMAWENVKQKIEAGETPIVRIMLSKLPGYGINDQLNTFLAIEEYFPEVQEVNVRSMLYTGRLSLNQLDEARSEINKFGSPAYQWLELKYNKLPALTMDYFYIILQEKVRMGKGLLEEQQQRFEQFAVDIENSVDYGSLLKKIFFSIIRNDLFHPIGPSSSRMEVLTIMKELHAAGYVTEKIVEKYNLLSQEWEILKMLVAKASYEPKGMVERIVQRIRYIAELETDVMLHLQHEIKEEYA